MSEVKRVMPLPEEMVMIRDAILIPHMIAMVEKSMNEIQNSPNVLKRAYAMTAQAIMDKLMADQFGLRRELSARNIKLYLENPETNNTRHIINYKYIYRGYHHEFGIVREVMRSEISVQLARYITDIGEGLRRK
ncbi:hypothetical protein [Paenibacillus sp. RUD330]|uniref:hypothetical protein n=1 Tax=Paenibacillus sp. RUD330 TaxID=2023772 RepID=UPI000B92D1EC|nr:hypothetical protein [Paenibacillus sp. RUD330]ASS66199.1 hypothetical protein CIC07_08605 [Paenibacillus sp. RUD330]